MFSHSLTYIRRKHIIYPIPFVFVRLDSAHLETSIHLLGTRRGLAWHKLGQLTQLDEKPQDRCDANGAQNDCSYGLLSLIRN